MKKYLLLFLTLCLACSVFAWQKTYNDESPQYKTYLSLKRISGSQQPIPTLPISADQLRVLLLKLDTSSFNSYEMNSYNNLLSELSMPSTDLGNDSNFRINIEGWASANSLIRTGSEKVIEAKDTAITQVGTNPIFDLGLDLDITQYFHMKYNHAGYVIDREKKFSNINFWSLEKVSERVGRVPFTDYISFGSSYFNFTIGRDRMSAGTGNLGNLGLSHNSYFSDFMKASAVYYPVSLDSTIIAASGRNRIEHTSFDSLNLVCLHRLSLTMFDWMNLTVYEGCLQYGLVSALDVRFTNPLMMMHNSYAFSEGTQNNFFGVDFNFALGKHSELTVQTFFDQIQMPSEVEKEMGNLPPNAYAFLAAWNSSFLVSNGFLNTYAEAVYTNPAVYLKEDNPEGKEDVRYYNVDLYLFTNSDSGYLGHKFGPDTVAFSIGASYETDRYSLSASTSFKATGAFGYGDGQIDHTGWTEDYFALISPTSFGGKSVQYTLSSKLSGTYQIMKGIVAESTLSFVKDWNHNHIQDNSWYDIELYIGVKADIIGGLLGFTKK